MVNYVGDYEYIESKGANLFTVILLPDSSGKFPVVVMRSPYVDNCENEKEENIVIDYLNVHKKWLNRGYAVVFQHCRGRGKSGGDCIPYINEREDGLELLDWIRRQEFYNGEIFLVGSSYGSSVHYTTAPFGNDIKGAHFGVQDTERYNICYRNGFLKKALHCSWYVGMYKAKSHMKKNYTFGSFDLLPLKDFTKTVFGEPVADFDEMLKAPYPDDEFWNTRFGGNDARNATLDVKFPVLFTTGFYDIYTGGIFDMWNSMNEESRNMSALVVSPYDHGDNFDAENSIEFPDGKRIEKFGNEFDVDWFDFVRGKSVNPPFKTGAVTYYSLFRNRWETERFLRSDSVMNIHFGSDELSYVYNPFDPPSFKGGLSRTFGGTVYQDKPGSRHDIISVYSDAFDEDVFVKGKMTAQLEVKSNCEDTCFYVRISIEKENGDYGLRDDITSLCYQLGEYKPGSVAVLNFEFDEHAFLIKKGERLRMDIASADNDHYVRHTNQRGLYSEQTTAKVATNTVYLKNSFLTLPVEK